MKRQEHAWVIAYVNSDLLGKLPKDLTKQPVYGEIIPNIPMVKVLKKQFKGKEEFEDVPLLFNYGFFRIPITLAINTDMMMRLKDDLSCVHGWVRDAAKRYGPKKLEDDEEPTRDWVYSDNNVMFATVKESQISHLMEIARANSIYSSDDISKIKEGDIIFLMGYPFQGMQAKVMSIDFRSKKIKVMLALDVEVDDFSTGREVVVHFENVFYSIYTGSHDEGYGAEQLIQDYNLNKRKNQQDEVQ